MSLSPSLSAFALGACLAAPAFAQSTACPIRWYGEPCRLVLDAGSIQAGSGLSVDLRMSGAVPNSLGVFVFGGAWTHAPLPLQNCPLLVRPDLLWPVLVDGRGEARFLLPAPADPRAHVLLQATAVTGLPAQPDFATSQSADMALQASGAQSTLTMDLLRIDTDQSPLQAGPGWQPSPLGGSGILGEFDWTLLRATALQDAQGRRIYEWDTDDCTIPGTHTLTGAPIRVQNGVFEFSRFTIPPHVHVTLLGTQPVQVHVSGRVEIEGVLDASAPPRNRLFHDPKRGQVGGLGGPGGARGGAGGNPPGLSLPLDGANGGDLALPAGHPKGSAPGSGGRGSFAHPRSGAEKDVVWILVSGQKVLTRCLAAGGGGGAWSGPGGKGVAEKFGTPMWPYQPGEFGPDAPGGVAFSLAPISTSVASHAQFLIGGSGGGGAGTHPLGPGPSPVWNAGAAGGGGGGALRLATGREIEVTHTGELLARGGDAYDWGSTNVATAPGGGGSGGSVLLQGLGQPRLAGRIDLSGGRGGTLVEASIYSIAARGGDGGPGFVRVEAPQAPSLSSLGQVIPSPTPDNVGALLALDASAQSLVMSKWLRLGVTRGQTRYVRYLLEGVANGQPLRYSNDPRLAPQPAAPGAWVVLHLQGASDENGSPGVRTRWFEADIDALSQASNGGPFLRYALRFDASRGPLPADLRIDRLEIWSTCR